jgi:FMN phosphatase YigB (HAD superfamily)
MYIWDYWKVLLTRGGFESERYITGDGAQFRPRSVKTDFDPAEFEKLIRIRVAEQTPPDDFAELATFRAFVSVLEFLERRGANVCLVTTPMPPAYRLAAEAKPVFGRILDRFDELARQYSFQRANFWNVVDELELFSDTDHLNEIGARKIVPRLLKKCFGERAVS